ncbi:tRNA isopentenyltransferase [Mycena filopes]|nr:tRNA isopentenyltransferase [Mycena filopes]
MQVYAGLDVLTNKVPEAERHGVEHLLMGFKQPGEQYVVGQWVKDAINAIDETHRREEIPIVVGGTSYWMQHLMFPDRLSGAPENAPTQSQGITNALASLPPHLLDLFNCLPPQPPDAAVDPDAAATLHLLLHNLDPAMAARWHWRDTRKVFRSLGIVKDTGRRPSDIISEQSEVASKPRYRTLCFWLYSEPSTLNQRLDDRVDVMIKRPLDEVRSLHSISQQAASENIDYTLGIYQAIGYKEFHGYLTAPQTEKGFDEALERMKISTRQYAKRQISWIRNKLLPAIYATNTEEVTVPTYALDATQLGETWFSNVRDPAVQITQKFLDNETLPDALTLSETARTMLEINAKPVDPTTVLNARRKVVCPICTVDTSQPVLVDEDRLSEHRQARTHRRILRKRTPEEHQEAQRLKNLDRPPRAPPMSSLDTDVDSGSLFFQ